MDEVAGLPKLNIVRKVVRLGLPILILLISGSIVFTSTAPRTSASLCSMNAPSSMAFTITLCFSSPDGLAPLTGVTPINVTVDVTGTNPGVQEVSFSLDKDYLLTQHSPPYSFVLPTDQFVDGSHLIQAQAVMTDGFSSTPARLDVIFRNGVSQLPTPVNGWKPTTGTAPAPGHPFILAATGDGAAGEPIESQVVNRISSWDPNLFIYLGDVYDHASPTEFYNWYAPDTFFGRFKAITAPTIGDEESANDVGLMGYRNYWNNAPHYYSFDAAGWHLVGLDSTLRFAQTTPDSAQFKWLIQDLTANRDDCTVVFFHDPVLKPGAQGPIQRLKDLWGLLAQHGVDLVLTGGAHNYQHWAPLDGAGNPGRYGVTQFVVGTGGHGLQPMQGLDSRVTLAIDQAPQAYGALRLKLNPNGANYDYINAAGKFLDSGVVACNGAPQDTAEPSVPGNLHAAASSANAVNLTWDESIDNTGIAGYTIYRDNVPLATVNSVAQSYTDTSVVSLSQYSYTVDAFDGAGNHSRATAPATVKTPGEYRYTFAAAADAYVSAENATNNYGTAKFLRADASPSVRTFLRFDVEGIAGTVLTATLRMYAESNSSLGYTVAGVPDDTWDERTITYDNAPGIATALPESSGPLVAAGWTSVNVTSFIRGNGPVDLALIPLGQTALRFSSRESGVTAPQLVIETDRPPVANQITVTETPTAQATNTVSPAATTLPTRLAAEIMASTPTPTAPVSGTIYFTIPTGDTYVSEQNPQGNYGSAKVLRVDQSPFVRSYLKFSVVGLKGQVVRAVLRIYANSNSKTGFEVHSVADTWWSEKSVSFANAPSFASEATASSGPLTKDSWVEADVTPLILGNGPYSFVLIGVGPTSISLASRESGPNAPQLVITTNP